VSASGRKRPLLSAILGGIYDRFTPKAAVFSCASRLFVGLEFIAIFESVWLASGHAQMVGDYRRNAESSITPPA
jgi:hypothetical protein